MNILPDQCRVIEPVVVVSWQRLLGAALRTTRHGFGKTCLEIATSIAMSDANLGRIERGVVPMSPAVLRRVATELGIRPSAILLGAEVALQKIAQYMGDRVHLLRIVDDHRGCMLSRADLDRLFAEMPRPPWWTETLNRGPATQERSTP